MTVTRIDAVTRKHRMIKKLHCHCIRWELRNNLPNRLNLAVGDAVVGKVSTSGQ